MSEPHPEDKMLVQAVANTIGKSIAFICLTIIAGMLFSVCKVNQTTIQECEAACGTHGIKEVTATSCECQPPEDASLPPFVLPRGSQ